MILSSLIFNNLQKEIVVRLNKLCVLGVGAFMLGGCSVINTDFKNAMGQFTGVAKTVEYHTPFHKSNYFDVKLYEKGDHYPCVHYTKLTAFWVYNNYAFVNRNQETVNKDLRNHTAQLGGSDVIDVHTLTGDDGSLETYGLAVICDETEAKYNKELVEQKEAIKEEKIKAKTETDEQSPWDS